MRILLDNELDRISGAGDFYFTLRIPTEDLSPSCVDALYITISNSIDNLDMNEAAKNLLFSCTLNDVLLLTSLAERGEYVKTEFF